jgi:hypothetical protein
MTKVFEYKAGSLVDKVGKQVGQAFDIINKRSEIGQAIETKGEDTSYINFPTFDRTDLRSWSCWIKFNKIDLITAVAFILVGSKMALGTSINGGFTLYSIRGSGYSQRKSNYSFKPRIWYQLVCNYDETGVPSLYINTIESTYSDASFFNATDDSLHIGKRNTGNAKSVQIAKLCFYTHELTEEERLADYKEFLQAQITEKPVRGFELVKPTDLSYLKDRGLLAAYNMKPNGSTLVDISGNSRHGTLNGGVINTKDGLGFNGVNGYVNCGNAIGYGSEMTIIGTIKPKYTSRINIIGKDNGVTRGFYVDILDTGRLRFVFSQTGSTIQHYDSVTPLGNNQKNTFAITFKGGVNSKIYINGALDITGATSLTSIFNNSLDFNIGFNVGLSNYFNGEIQDIRVYNRELTEQEIKDYHNSFVKPVILEDFSNYAVSETRPKEWQIISGEFEIKEDTEKKYLECTSTGTIKINHNTTTDADASIDYNDGGSWTTVYGTLSDLITTHAWLSKEGNYLLFTLTTGQAIANIKIYDGVRQ